jgi:hypothetical protein
MRGASCWRKWASPTALHCASSARSSMKMTGSPPNTPHSALVAIAAHALPSDVEHGAAYTLALTMESWRCRRRRCRPCCSCRHKKYLPVSASLLVRAACMHSSPAHRQRVCRGQYSRTAEFAGCDAGRASGGRRLNALPCTCSSLHSAFAQAGADHCATHASAHSSSWPPSSAVAASISA